MSKSGWFFVIIVLALLVGLNLYIAKNKKPVEHRGRSWEQKEEAPPVVERTQEELDADLYWMMETEMESIDILFKSERYDGSIDDIWQEYFLFEGWGDRIREGEVSENEKNKELVNKFKAKVKGIQEKEFPVMRKRYGDQLAKKMWEHDIYVDVSGVGNRVITFTGAVFAANANKKEYQEMIGKDLRSLGFKESRYKWYKGDKEYTRYVMGVQEDGEPVDRRYR